MELIEFKQKMTELQQIIIDGIMYFSAWRALSYIDEKTGKTLNRYKGLFLPAQQSFKKMALLEFSKIFNRDKRTSSLRNILEAAIVNRELLTPYAEDSDFQEILHWLAANEDLLKRLKDFRNQRLAHHDSIVVFKSLLYGEVKTLIEEIQKEFNLLKSLHDNGETAFEFIVEQTENDVLEVIKIMRQDRDNALKLQERRHKEI